MGSAPSYYNAGLSGFGDLLGYNLDELEAVAEAKGGIRRLLGERWAQTYKAASPRGLFGKVEKRAVARCCAIT